MNLINTILNQTEILYKNVQNLLEVITEEEYKLQVAGWYFWKQIYHMLRSLDKNIIDPENYCYPVFHTDGLDSMKSNPDEDSLSKDVLVDYFEEIKARTTQYLNSLEDRNLSENVEFDGKNYTRLALVIAQYRHAMYHVGYLHCCIKNATSSKPRYVGLY